MDRRGVGDDAAVLRCALGEMANGRSINRTASPTPLGGRSLYPRNMSVDSSPRLVRPRQGRVVGGVAAGLADRFGISRNLMRVLLVLSMVLPGPQILIYIALWIVIPEE